MALRKLSDTYGKMLYRRLMRSRITLLLSPIRASVTSATASAQAEDDAEASTSPSRFVSTRSRSEVVSSSFVRRALTRLMSSAVTRLMSALLTRIRRRSNGSDAAMDDDDRVLAAAEEKGHMWHKFLPTHGRGRLPPQVQKKGVEYGRRKARGEGGRIGRVAAVPLHALPGRTPSHTHHHHHWHARAFDKPHVDLYGALGRA